MLECKCCKEKFNAKAEKHYIARDNDVCGIVLNREEPTLYDAFDCPKCGCQIIIGERKRPYIAPKEEDNDE